MKEILWEGSNALWKIHCWYVLDFDEEKILKEDAVYHFIRQSKGGKCKQKSNWLLFKWMMYLHFILKTPNVEGFSAFLGHMSIIGKDSRFTWLLHLILHIHKSWCLDNKLFWNNISYFHMKNKFKNEDLMNERSNQLKKKNQK